ncbi:MAG: PDZ domain-containing protein [Aureliella sp.]
MRQSLLLLGLIPVILVATTLGITTDLRAQTETKRTAQLELNRLEQEAFRSSALKASEFTVQIETFGGLERLGEERITDGPTTGTIVSSEGWIISSAYAFRQKPGSVIVNLPNGERSSAKIVARDYSRELVLLKIDVDEELPQAEPSRMAEQGPIVGQWVNAIGKIYDKRSVTQSLGIISATGRAYGRAVQTDAKVSPVNYGGPLIDLEGRVVGILAPISPGTFFDGDSSELYDSGIGFAIPLQEILIRLERLQKGNDIRPGKLGVITSDQNEMAGPVQVVGALPGSAAGKADVRAGDIILKANDQPVRILSNLRHAIASVDAGNLLQLEVLRNGKIVTGIDCTLTESIPTYRRRYLGIRVRTTAGSPESKQNEGVSVVTVDSDSPAAEAGMKAGMKITALNGKPLTELSHLDEQLAVAELDRTMAFEVEVNGKSEEIRVQPTEYPNLPPSELAPLYSGRADDAKTESVEVSLGDFTNTAFAIVPPALTDEQKGLAIVFPTPGETTSEEATSIWEPFCLEHGWIVVVVNSADPQRWSMSEIEIAERVLGRMQKSYSISEKRVALVGMGVGGRLALVAANTLKSRISGVATIGTDVRRLALRQDNMPLQSLDYLLAGEREQLTPAAGSLRDRGFNVTSVESNNIEAEKWSSLPISDVGNWLEGLSRY